jgi:excinuclease UvrABC ATPase subunit
VLALTVAQAVELFQKRKEIVRRLQAMHDVGLAYLTLGQPLSTLSGGECQRIKLASELHKDGSVYVMDDVRKVFAAANKVDAGLFSFNSKGACEKCNGSGVLYTDLAFLDGVKLPCDTCEGRRFKDEVLAYRVNGKSITDVLALTVTQALDFFTQKEIVRKLEAMRDVGLGYLTLGQPLSTLSGGECQRIKLASELHKNGNVYVLDEPTTGLHMSDLTQLMAIIDRLVDAGNTVIAIEHNLDVIRRADHVIDLGPEGGSKGGRVIFEGTPRQLMDAPGSLTGEHLARGRSLAAV